MKLRTFIRSIIVVIPAICGVLVVMAKAPLEYQQNSASSQTLSDGLILIGSFLVSVAVKYIQTSYSNVKATAQEAKKVADDTPSKSEFKTLQEHIDTLEGKHREDVERLTSQVEMLVLNYRSVSIERDRAREGLEAEIKAHSETKKELANEIEVVAGLYRTVEKLEERINELERRIEKSEGINELANKIIAGIDGLLMKALLPTNPQTGAVE